MALGISPNPITWPLPPHLRVALWGLFVGGQLAWRIYENHGDGQDELDGPAFPEFRRAQMRFNRATPTGTTEDVAVCTFDFLKFDNDGPVAAWEVEDYEDVEARLDTLAATLVSKMPLSHTMIGYRWYQMKFADPVSGKKYLPSGGPARVISKSLAGTQSAASPYQLAATITERTALRGHWGRVYVPFAANLLADTGGRISATHRDALASAYNTFLEGCHTDGFAPVVPVLQIDKQPVRGLLSVTQVAVDDIPDIQRRRRPKMVGARSILPV